MGDELLDVYSDYLICSSGQATARGLNQVDPQTGKTKRRARMLACAYGHDEDQSRLRQYVRFHQAGEAQGQDPMQPF